MRFAGFFAFGWLLWNGTAWAQGAPAPPMVVPSPGQPATAPAAAPAPAPTVLPTPPPGWILAPSPGAQPPAAPPPPAPSAPAYLPPAGVAPAPVRAAPAYAAASGPTIDPYVRRPLVVEGHLSFAGPVGWVGFAVDYSLSRYLAVAGGGGLGSSGLQLGAMARVRVPFDTVAAGFGAGVSGGPYSDNFLRFDESDVLHWDIAYWANTEGFFEIRTRKGFSVRPYMGTGALLNPGAGKPLAADYTCTTTGTGSGRATTCANQPSTREPSRILFYMGAAVGYAFEL